jgi:hypothetical protein
LIPLNVQSPFETVDRAKKLLVFSWRRGTWVS